MTIVCRIALVPQNNKCWWKKDLINQWLWKIHPFCAPGLCCLSLMKVLEVFRQATSSSASSFEAYVEPSLLTWRSVVHWCVLSRFRADLPPVTSRPLANPSTYFYSELPRACRNVGPLANGEALFQWPCCNSERYWKYTSSFYIYIGMVWLIELYHKHRIFSSGDGKKYCKAELTPSSETYSTSLLVLSPDTFPRLPSFKWTKKVIYDLWDSMLLLPLFVGLADTHQTKLALPGAPGCASPYLGDRKSSRKVQCSPSAFVFTTVCPGSQWQNWPAQFSAVGWANSLAVCL